MAAAEGNVLIDAFPVVDYGAPIVNIGERFLVGTDVGLRAALAWSSVCKFPVKAVGNRKKYFSDQLTYYGQGLQRQHWTN